MNYISRSQWSVFQIKNFLSDPQVSQLKLYLYTSEARRLEKKFPIKINVGPTISNTDLRHFCIIKESDAW